MEELVFRVHVRSGEAAELWLDDARSGKRVTLPDAFWRSLAESLREVGQVELAERLEAALAAVITARLRDEARKRCMERVYSEEECWRCQELIREDLEG